MSDEARKAAIDPSNLSESQLMDLMAIKFDEAEKRLKNSITQAFFDSIKLKVLTPEEEALYQKQQRIAKIKRLALEPFRRIAGAWRVLLYGECGRCECTAYDD